MAEMIWNLAEWRTWITLVTPELEHPQRENDDLSDLLEIEQKAWGTAGENLEASREKILARIASFSAGITLAGIRTPPQIWELLDPVGSQYSFRFAWDGNPASLTSWDECTARGWTDRVHRPDGNTGFLVGVGVIPSFRRVSFSHHQRWDRPMRASELLIAVTLDKLFRLGVERIIGNARIPGYHLHPELTVEDYCRLRREDDMFFDPVLRFHERMGAEILKPVLYSMEDPESSNAGCWVIYRKPFEG